MMLWSLFVVLSAGPVDAAKAHLQKGQLDDVLFDLEGKTLSAAEKPEAVKVLSAAAKAALDTKDPVMAEHFAGMALKHDAKSAGALEAASRAAFAQQEFGAAEKHADAWIVVEPKSAAARLLRAELAAEAGDWVVVVEHAKAVTPETPALATLRVRAERELTQRSEALSELKTVAKAMAEAERKAAESPSVRPLVAEGSSAGVVLYSTSWCGYCKKARAWLTQKGVTFVERDIEKDMSAMEELARKQLAAGVRGGGVPVLDVRGKLIVGFDPKRIEDAL